VFQGKEESPSLTLNQKLEMMHRSAEGTSKAETGQKPGVLYQTVSPVVKAKEKFSKETEGATPVNTGMIRKKRSLIADMGKVV